MKLFNKFAVGLIIISLWTGCNGYTEQTSNTPTTAQSPTYQYNPTTSPQVQTNNAEQAPQNPVPIQTYTNSSGNVVQSPTYYNLQPQGATAQCGDGTYSFSQHRSGACSHHGGVTNWL